MRKQSKLVEVVRNHSSGIRVRFDDSTFNYGDEVTDDLRYGTIYYISNKQNGIYDLIPRCEHDAVNRNPSLRVGTTFYLVQLKVGEYDAVVSGPTEAI